MWARSVDNSHVTYYDYDANTGELREIDYSDTQDDPDVAFTYNRLGRQETVTDAVGTRTFAYNSELQISTETIDGSGGGLYSKTITRDYEDGSGNTVDGRNAGFHIGGDYNVDYHYDTTTGRLDRITGEGLDGTYGVTYSRLANSDAVEYTRFKSDSDADLATARRVLVSYRDLLDYVENKAGATTISKYDYGLDTLGRRTQVLRTGTAFNQQSPDDGFIDLFDYNDRNELTDTDRYEWTESGGTGDQLDDFGEFDYDYDPIGNRDTFTLDGGTAVTYEDHVTNRYESTSGGQSESFSYDDDGNLTGDDTFTYVWDCENRLIEVYPASPGAGSKKLVFDYDYRSRRVRKRVYDWDDQEEEWETEESTDLKFVYDGWTLDTPHLAMRDSRRASPAAASQGWNVVMVLDGNAENATLRKYTWGLDLSGLSGVGSVSGIHGAGGVGGLLSVEETGTGGTPKYWFLYDGNGNVGQVLDASDQSIAARYEYGPYGNIIGPDDDEDGDWKDDASAYALTNPFRFSTKWLDTELADVSSGSAIGDTGLYYYGYRYYSPRLGRWINRDPLQEWSDFPLTEEPNLYAAISNSPINSIDNLGMLPTPQLGHPCTCPCKSEGASGDSRRRGIEKQFCTTWPCIWIPIIGTVCTPGMQTRSVNLVCKEIKSMGHCRFVRSTTPGFGPWSRCKRGGYL